MASKSKKEDTGRILRRRPGTPPRGTELDTSLDNGWTPRTDNRKQTGTSQIRNKDDGLDKIECKFCHKLFMKRGINIHLAKSKCGKMNTSPNSQRIISKTEENQTRETHHSGKVFKEKRRVPFIVSQTFHKKATTESHSNELQSTELCEDELTITEETEVLETRTETVKQRTIADWRNENIAEKSDHRAEPDNNTQGAERNKSTSRKGDATNKITRYFGSRTQPEKSNQEFEQKSSRRKKVEESNKITSYFGIKVKGESNLKEWLTAIGNLSPKKDSTPKGEVPEHSAMKGEDQKVQVDTVQEVQDHTVQTVNEKERLELQDSWEISEEWEEETGDLLTITQKELEELRVMVTQGDDQELLADHHLFIRREDLKSLYNRNYLNGTIIDEYMLMIKARNPEGIAVMNTYFYQKFDSLNFEEAYMDTRSWIKEDLTKKESIFIPVCKNDHWRLIHIDIKQKVVAYLDSIVGTRKTTAAPWLMKRFVEKYFEEKGQNCSFQTKILRNIPIQHDGVSCGVFLCAYAERLSRKASFNFHQSNMANFRWKMTWEIMNSSLKESIKVKEASSNTAAETRRKPQKKTVEKKKTADAKKQEKFQEKADELGRRKKIEWPKGNSDEWKKLDTDLSMILREVGKTPEAKAELHPEIIYKFSMERFGEESTGKKKKWAPSRRVTKCQKLRQEIKSLNTAFQQAAEEEKPAIKELQAERLRNLRIQKRAESVSQKRRKNKDNTDKFYKQPFAFARKVLDPEVKGNLESTKEEVEEYLKSTHGDGRREEDLGDIEGLYEYPKPEVEFQSEPPTWKEFQRVLKKARAKAAAGPNGVPYKLYKNCPGIAKLLWWYIRSLWKKNKMSDTWRRADGVLIPKEDGAKEIGKFRTISLLNVEGKLFWKLKADKLTSFIMQNKYIDESIQKGGVPGVSGCIEHTAVLSQLIAEAKKHKKDLVAVWLDIANAYGSMTHKLLQMALKRAHIPEDVQELVASYYSAVEIRFSANKFTTGWQRVEKGIVTGCTLSVILFALSMTMLISSTRKETKGPVTESGQIQENSRLYMDDVSTTTETTVQTHHLLKEVSRFFDWARLTVKASKCRAMVIQRGVVNSRPILWKDQQITSVKDKAIRYLGKEYNHTLTEQQQMNQTMETVKASLKKIDKTFVAGRIKAWIVQNMLLPRLLWPLTIYSFPQSRVEEMERKLTASVKRWMGIPKSLSTELMYARSSVMQLPFSSLVEEVKVTRARTKVMLEMSHDACIKNANINLDAGRKWKVSTAVEEAKSKLRLQEIAGIANIGREGLGMQHRQYYSKSTQSEKRKLVTQKVREAEEERRLVKIAGLAKQGRSLEWQVQQRKLKDADMRRTTESTFQFVLKAVYDLLPTPQNLNLWYRTEEHRCQLCGGIGTLDHILTGCKTALTQGRYTYRHDRVLRELAYWVDEKRKIVNSMPLKKRSWVKFLKAGEKAVAAQQKIKDSFLNVSRDWRMQVDLPETPLSIPGHVAATQQRPDIILTSDSVKKLVIVELTIPTEARVNLATALKRTKYEEGVARAAEVKGWTTTIYTVEMGCRGFPAQSMGRMLGELGYQGRQKKMILQKLSSTTEEASQYIWKTSRYQTWNTG